jgi:hypothetical protein
LRFFYACLRACELAALIEYICLRLATFGDPRITAAG